MTRTAKAVVRKCDFAFISISTHQIRFCSDYSRKAKAFCIINGLASAWSLYVSDQNDPLADLSSAARSRSGVRPRKVRPVVKHSTSSPITTRKRKRPAQSNATMFIIFGAMGLIVLLGVILAVVVINSKTSEPVEQTQRERQRQRPIRDDGPGSMFRDVKAQDPSK